MGSHLQSSQSRHGIWRATLIAAAIATVLGLPQRSDAGGAVEWDPQASKELAAALHHMHHVWNSGDVASVKRLLMGDDVLVSFELDPTNHTPIRLASKGDIDSFVDKVIRAVDQEGLSTAFEHPTVNCRATPTFGICTEECTINFTRPNGAVRTDKLWSTAAAVKVDGEWRWIQWQMAVAGK